MSDKINLVKGNKAKRFEQERMLRILRLASFASVSVVAIVSLAFFFLVARSPIEELREEEKAAISQVKPHEEKAGKLLFTANRLTDITNIVEKRTTFDGVLNGVTKIIPTGMQIDSLSLDKKFFLMTVTSPSLSSVNTLLEGIEEMSENKKIFTKITLDGLTLDPRSGNYIISILGNFP